VNKVFKVTWLNILLINLLSLLLVTLTLSLIWDLYLKKSFTEEIYSIAKLSESIRISGIVSYEPIFNNIDWSNIIVPCNNFYMNFTYAYTWRHANIERLRRIAESGTTLYVILPDYEEDSILYELSRRMPGLEKDELKRQIIKAVIDFTNLGAHIYLLPRALLNSYYLTDKRGVIAIHNLDVNRDQPVRALICSNEGDLYQYIKKDIDYLISISREFIDNDFQMDLEVNK
jgi:hypothetical protein